MDHWTSSAFHATVVSPRMMYEDVTVGFSDGTVTFTGKPLRNWRAWRWVGLVVRLVLLTAGVVAVAAVLGGRSSQGVTADVVLRSSIVVAIWAFAFWFAGVALRRYATVTRTRARERIARLPLAEISAAALSGRTLSLVAPFDERNRSGRWRLKVDSHDQGESLLALLARR
jgi:hypothetical protein